MIVFENNCLSFSVLPSCFLTTVLVQLKERGEKLEYWKKRDSLVQEKKEKKEDLRCQSSMWIDENKLEARTLEALVDGPLSR